MSRIFENINKNPAYRRHWISWPMLIVAPLPCCNCLFFGRWSKTTRFNNLWRKERKKPFFLTVSSQANIRNKFIDQKSPWHPEVGVLGGVQNRGFKHLRKKTITFFFENYVLAGQYEEYIIRPEVSPTPRSGCFAMAQTHTHTDIATLKLNWFRGHFSEFCLAVYYQLVFQRKFIWFKVFQRFKKKNYLDEMAKFNIMDFGIIIYIYIFLLFQKYIS